MKRNEAKYNNEYGTDVIERSLISGVDFCYYSAVKYATRLYKVSKMPFFKKWYYRLILGKGGRKLDHSKMIDFCDRMAECNKAASIRCLNECEQILKNGLR